MVRTFVSLRWNELKDDFDQVSTCAEATTWLSHTVRMVDLRIKMDMVS
jgi:hypothetical protein